MVGGLIAFPQPPFFAPFGPLNSPFPGPGGFPFFKNTSPFPPRARFCREPPGAGPPLARLSPRKLKGGPKNFGEKPPPPGKFSPGGRQKGGPPSPPPFKKGRLKPGLKALPRPGGFWARGQLKVAGAPPRPPQAPPPKPLPFGPNPRVNPPCPFLRGQNWKNSASEAAKKREKTPGKKSGPPPQKFGF